MEENLNNAETLLENSKDLHSNKGSFRDPNENSKLASRNEYISPFHLPSNEEVFLYNENLKKQKFEERETNRRKKIWDKGTAATKNVLHHYKKFGESTTTDESVLSQKKQYSSKDRTLINTALEVINAREKAKQQLQDPGKKESNVELIEQKKEMFLVTMSHGIIQKEIEKLKKNTEEKKLALDQTEDMLKKDHEDFQKHIDDNKKRSDEAQLRADDKEKEKKKAENETRQISNQLTTMRHDKLRNEETMNTYKDHKEFLDRIAPKEWHETKAIRRKEVIENAKKKFITNMIKNYEEEEEKEKASRGKKTKTSSPMSKGQIEELFFKLVNKGEIDEVEEFEDEYEMYFKNPQQLIDNFAILEEKNITLIENTQESAQKLEELKTHYENLKQTLEAKIYIHKETKDMHKKHLDEINKDIKNLQTIRHEHSHLGGKKDAIFPIKKVLLDLYFTFKEDIGNFGGDGETNEEIKMLSAIEIHLNHQLKTLKSFEPKKVKDLYKQYDDLQKLKEKSEENKKKDLLTEEKNKKNLEKLLQPTKKRKGRHDMVRSKPKEKPIPVDEVKVNLEEEEDKKFFTWGENDPKFS